MKWAIATEPNRRDPQPFETFVAGNLCFNADMLSRHQAAAPAEAGSRRRADDRLDRRLFTDFFAANANSFPRPARILIEADGSWSYTHRRDTYDEIFSLKGS